MTACVPAEPECAGLGRSARTDGIEERSCEWSCQPSTARTWATATGGGPAGLPVRLR
jgi:hypothetical protein